MEKNIDEIYQEMLSLFHEVSGYLPHKSCDLAARLYATAAQLQGLYHQAQWVLDQAFPQSAQGAYLDQHALLRGLNRSVATCSTGSIRFGVNTAAASDLTIAAGSVCMTEAGIRFATISRAVLPAGSLYVDVPATAMEPGRQGNVAAGTVTVMAAMPAGIRACTNPEPFNGGDDAESDESLRHRLLESFRHLPNGANAAYYEQVARSYTGVAAAVAVPRPRGIGSVDVYVATDAGTPDAELLDAINSYLQTQREISVDLSVRAPATETVNLTLALQPAAGYTFMQAKADAEEALRSAFTGSLLGKGVMLAQLGELVYHLRSVGNYRFLTPSSDVTVSPTVLPILGTIAIQPWEV